jgi:hypothetical protein
MIKSIAAALLTLSLIGLAGCDQVENSTKQLLSTATDSAKKVIDETHKAATQSLDDAKKELSVIEPKKESEKPQTSKDI